MNHYEELGIRQDASVEEIRQAYKQLARILHPDGQPDPALRAMSEIQMKRLNEIVAILVNPWQRIEYDYLEQTPSAFAITWEYDNFIMTFMNAEIPNPAAQDIPLWGTYFYGRKGVALINRLGYKIWVKPAAAGRRGAPPEPPIEAKFFKNPKGWAGDATPLHARNFLDCVKSRQQPIAHIDIGYHSSLPCIIALLSIRNKRQYAWDSASNTAKPA